MESVTLARNLVLWPVEKLKPYERNARTHSEEQVEQIAASIATFGFTNPVLVDSEQGIIAGHGRVMAAKRLGLAEVPVVVLDHLTDTQRRAYIIADNKLALNAGWDDAILSEEIKALEAEDFDLDLLGFSYEELLPLTRDAEVFAHQSDEDEVPESLPSPKVVRGEVYTLGKHRLMCGDSTAITDVDRLMGGMKADLCFTSPPYGQQRDYGAAKEKVQDWDQLMNDVFGILPTHERSQLLVNLGLIHRDGEWVPYWENWIEYMRQAGWKRFGFYVWDQGPGLPGDWNGRLAPAHEFIFHFCRETRKPNKTKECAWAGEANHGSGLRAKDGSVSSYSHFGRSVQSHKIPDSVVRVMRHKARGIEVAHPAVFSVELFQEIASAYSDEGEVVFEPFAGSGTAAIACEKLNRKAFMMEIDPKYCGIILDRWQKYTGKKAFREDGKAWDEIRAE